MPREPQTVPVSVLCVATWGRATGLPSATCAHMDTPCRRCGNPPQQRLLGPGCPLAGWGVGGLHRQTAMVHWYNKCNIPLGHHREMSAWTQFFLQKHQRGQMPFLPYTTAYNSHPTAIQLPYNHCSADTTPTQLLHHNTHPTSTCLPCTPIQLGNNSHTTPIQLPTNVSTALTKPTIVAYHSTSIQLPSNSHTTPIQPLFSRHNSHTAPTSQHPSNFHIPALHPHPTWKQFPHNSHTTPNECQHSSHKTHNSRIPFNFNTTPIRLLCNSHTVRMQLPSNFHTTPIKNLHNFHTTLQNSRATPATPIGHRDRRVFLHSARSTGTAHAQRPIVSQLPPDDPEHHPAPGKPRPQGNNSRFTQHSGIFRGKCRLF